MRHSREGEAGTCLSVVFEWWPVVSARAPTPSPPPFLLSTSSPIHLFPVPRHQKTKDEIFEMMKGILEEQKCDVPTSADDPKCKINLEQFKKLVTDDK